MKKGQGRRVEGRGGERKEGRREPYGNVTYEHRWKIQNQINFRRVQKQ